MSPDSDVFGRALLDWAEGGTTPEVLEREDGFTQVGAGPDVYLSAFKGMAQRGTKVRPTCVAECWTLGAARDGWHWNSKVERRRGGT